MLDPICLALGPVVSFIVSWLKRIPWVAKYPKLVALVVSFVLSFVKDYTFPSGFPETVARVAVCVLAAWTGSIATYEIVTKPVVEAMKGPKA